MLIPRHFAERAVRSQPSWSFPVNCVDKGGHFAAWEQPELFAAEVRAAFDHYANRRSECGARNGPPPADHRSFGTFPCFSRPGSSMPKTKAIPESRLIFGDGSDMLSPVVSDSGPMDCQTAPRRRFDPLRPGIMNRGVDDFDQSSKAYTPPRSEVNTRARVYGKCRSASARIHPEPAILSRGAAAACHEIMRCFSGGAHNIRWK